MVARKRYSCMFLHVLLYFLLCPYWQVIFYLFTCIVKQLPPTSPGYNNAPFKFTKYSNAYMLVYVRESDKEKVFCDVDEKDIAEHLRVIHVLGYEENIL